jgi:hypothetical protein
LTFFRDFPIQKTRFLTFSGTNTSGRQNTALHRRVTNEQSRDLSIACLFSSFGRYYARMSHSGEKKTDCKQQKKKKNASGFSVGRRAVDPRA